MDPHQAESTAQEQEDVWNQMEFEEKDDGRLRARLVALGHAAGVPGVDCQDSFAPVINNVTWRLLLILHLCQTNNHDIDQIDIKTAFLCGDLDEPMYMKPPAGHSVPPNTILELNKAIHGLAIASRQWCNKWTHHLMNNCGFKQSWTEPCLFWRVRSNQEKVCSVVHVDDCLSVGTRLGIDNAIADISNEARGGFKIKRLGNKFQSHLRCDIKTVKQGLVLCQPKLIETIRENFEVARRHHTTPMAPKTVLQKPLEGDTLLSSQDQTKCRSTVGKLLCLVKMSRPDIANVCNGIVNAQSCPN